MGIKLPTGARVYLDANVLIYVIENIEGYAARNLPDAIHVASAIASGCSHFITNDKQLRGDGGLTILTLAELVA